jgi:hypothetical protein
MKMIPGFRRRHYLARLCIFLIITSLITGIPVYYGVAGDDNHASQNLEIRTWYDLDAIRDNLAGNHTLMNDLDSTIAGYDELAGPTANGGKGWQPIGGQSVSYYTPSCMRPGTGIGVGWDFLTGTFDGQGYEIRDLFINRTDDFVGLFGGVLVGGVIKNISVVKATVTGKHYVGGLVGDNGGGGYTNGGGGIVSNSYATGTVTGAKYVGGLVGRCRDGTVSNSYSAGNVNGHSGVGGLVGYNYYSSVTDSYSTGSVTGDGEVGGLVGWNDGGTVSKSYSTGNVTGNDISVGGLMGVNLGIVSNSYSTGSVTGDWYVGGLVGFNDGTVSNSYSTGNVAGEFRVGGLVGVNYATVINSFATGNVTGDYYVGGLVGHNNGGTVTNSFWDIETSGQNVSAGGTGKNTTEMKDIVTFSGATWKIITVGGIGERNITYGWNIVNGVTYPFLSWQP